MQLIVRVPDSVYNMSNIHPHRSENDSGNSNGYIIVCQLKNNNRVVVFCLSGSRDHDKNLSVTISYATPLKAIFKTSVLIAGTDTRHVHAVAVSAIEIAEKGKASFSSTKAAVPNP